MAKPGEIVTRWDGGVRGLGVRFNKSGVAVWIVKYQLCGRQVLKTLCTLERLALAEARDLVREIKRESKSGRDPEHLIARQRGKGGIAALPGIITVREFCQIYLTQHAFPHKRSANKDRQRLEKYILPHWGDIQLKHITRLQVAQLSIEIGTTEGRPYAANRLIEQLRTMFRLAILWDYLPPDHPNPAQHVRRYHEQPRDRFVTRSEMIRLMTAIADCPDLYVRTAMEVELSLGLRVSELLSLRWDWLDIDEGTLHLPITKNGRSHLLPLPEHIKSLLIDLPHKDGCPYVFPGRSPTTHKSRLDRDWYAIRRAAKLDDVRFHDLRRTVGSWLIQATGSLVLVGDVLNQTTPHVTRIYSRYTRDDIRQALEAHSQRIEQCRQAST